MDRQSSHVTTGEHRDILLKEKEQIAELRSYINGSSYLNAFTRNQQEQLLKGRWRIGSSWADLGINAGFHKKYFDNIYSYLCGYSHSSYISALQVGQANSVEEQKILTKGILGIGTVIMAHYAFSYSSIFKCAGRVLNANNAARIVAEKWHFGPEDMAEVYDR